MDESSLKKWMIPRLRRISYTYPPRNEAKKKQKVSPATFECEHCGVWIYEGFSVDNMAAIALEHPDKEVIMGKSKMDHIEPVIDVFDGFIDMGEYVKRMFCSEEGFQLICESCHFFKTEWENHIRKNP